MSPPPPAKPRDEASLENRAGDQDGSGTGATRPHGSGTSRATADLLIGHKDKRLGVSPKLSSDRHGQKEEGEWEEGEDIALQRLDTNNTPSASSPALVAVEERHFDGFGSLAADLTMAMQALPSLLIALVGSILAGWLLDIVQVLYIHIRHTNIRSKWYILVTH